MPEITEEQMKEFEDAKAKAAEFEAAKTKLEKELEDTRMEVLTPEYTKFLEEQEKAKNTSKSKDVSKESNDDLDKLTPKQILDRAKKEVLEEIEAAKRKEADDAAKDHAARTAREIKEFAKTHEDFEQFRPIMYGLSLDEKNKNLNLEALYEKAKAHVNGLKKGSSDEEKNRSRRSSNERPGNDSESFAKLKKMSNEDIGKEALKEVMSELGPIPQA